ncbi:hypothetical protein MCUN1_000381 [Malassezia cuniculi]|uniref:CMP/dCMP-type deaminase domain-containing protein n=1 Tax=Malassezia cuniculi TaxID=948313 RepID=A0AAF0J4W2_9BASI|nr:hypothetical protein MCUN1_000381 [Malassezia cuniculi]
MPSNRADKMRNAAAQEALRSAMRYRHGAVITKGGKIISQGHNHVRTGFSGPLTTQRTITLPSENTTHTDPQIPPPSQSHFSMHAEMHAITSALRGARPVVTRALPMTEMLDSLDHALANMSKELKKNHRHARAVPSDALRPCGQWVGAQEEKRWRAEFHAQRAERIARRKQEKRERKARGAL